MKRLQILQFKNIYQQIYTLDNAGDYHNPETNTKYHLLTCLFNNLQINQIKDKDNNRIFTLGEEIIVNSDKVTIIKINLVGAGETFHAQFKLSNTTTVLMPNATKIAPVIPAATVNSLNELETRILKDFNNRTLKFDIFVRKRSETFEEFKKEFFARNNEFTTIWSDTKVGQTPKGRRRSLGDVFMICKYYYPSITLLEVVKWLYSKPYFKDQYCGGVKKRVWRMDYDKMEHENMKDEYGNLTSYYKTFIK